MKRISSVLVMIVCALSSFAQSKEETFAAVVAENLSMFQSKPLFMSWASRQVKKIDLHVKPDGEEGTTGYGWGRDYRSITPKIEEMLAQIENINIEFTLVRPVNVGLKATFSDSDYNALFEGETYFWPVEFSAGWRIPSWVQLEMQIARKVAVKLPGVTHLQVVLRAKYGELVDSVWLQPDLDGYFYIPRQAIDNEGEFIAYSGDHSTDSVAVSIRSGEYLKRNSVKGFVKPTMQGLEILHDPSRLDITPKARYGQGEDLLSEVTVTQLTVLKVKAQTTEGEYADVIHVIELATDSFREFVQEPGQDTLIALRPGTYHIYALWDYFIDNSAQYDHYGYTGGGKGGGTAGGDGGW